MTQKEKIFNNFLSRVTDDMFTVWTPQEVEEELSEMLKNAIPKFRFPKIPLLDDNGELNEEISYGEVEILSMLMVKEWLERQIHTVELTELQYTGSDAKAMNTSGQLKALIATKDAHIKTFNKQLDYYHMVDSEEKNTRVSAAFNMSGKGGLNGSSR